MAKNRKINSIKGKNRRNRKFSLTLIIYISAIVISINIYIVYRYWLNFNQSTATYEVANEKKMNEIKNKINQIVVKCREEEIRLGIDKDKSFYREEIKKAIMIASVYIEDTEIVKIIYEDMIFVVNNNFDVILVKKGENEIIVDNVFKMKERMELSEGTIVYTLGYYECADNGESEYKIVATEEESNDEKIVKLNNGLNAILQVNDGYITVDQYGAKGDGNIDSWKQIQDSFQSGVSRIAFGYNKEYKVTKALWLNIPNIEIMGNGAILFTDNDYASKTTEWFFNIINNNIKLDSLIIQARETIDVGYKTQLCVMKASKIEIKNCSFLVPNTVVSNKEYTNIDLYTGWHDIVIDNCKMEILHDGIAGGCIWIRDLYKLGCNNLIFTNNSCKKICHDEILAAFLGNIENITIANNNFCMQENTHLPSEMCFTLGSEGATLKNVIFENNTIDAISSGGVIWSTNVTDIKVKNNKIKYTKSNTTSKAYVIKAYNCSNFRLTDNNIEIQNKNQEITQIINSVSVVDNNIIKCETNITGDVINDASEVKNNEIYLDNSVDTIFKNSNKILNNKVVAKDNVNKFFEYYNIKLKTDYDIRENVIEYYNVDDTSTIRHLLIINGVGMNDYKIYFNYNNVIAPNSSSQNRLLFFVIKDNDRQNLYINGNKIEGFENKYIGSYGHNIVITMDLYEAVKSQLLEKCTKYLSEYESELSSSENMENVKMQLEELKKYIDNRKTIEELGDKNDVLQLLSNIYKIGDMIIYSYKSGEFISTIESVSNMLKNLQSICDDIELIYENSEGDRNSSVYSTEISKKIEEFESLAQYYQDLNISSIVFLKDKLGEYDLNNTYKDTLCAYNLINWANILLQMYADNYLSMNPVKIEYSSTNLTNKDVVATLICVDNLNVKNNSSGNMYTFKENGEFTFEYTRRGKEYKETAKVDYIDKTPPTITGIENEKIYLDNVTPIISDDNLKTVKLYKDSSLIETYKQNDTISEDGRYSLEAEDEAGNRTNIEFDISRIPATITYSQSELTNKDVIATIESNYDIQVTNNSNSKQYTFTENGEFTFEYTIRGQAFTVNAWVDYIDKTPPIVTGVQNGKTYYSKVAVNIQEDNLESIIFTKNGEQIEFTNGMTLEEYAIYELIAKDKAGNEIDYLFEIAEKVNDTYKMDDSYIKNIDGSTPLTTFKEKLALKEEFEILRGEEILQDTEVIATGDILKTSAGESYTLVVKGDLDSNGSVNIVDLLKLRKYVSTGAKVETIDTIAADIDLDDKLNIIDILKLRKILAN